jgi:hypothetical protein
VSLLSPPGMAVVRDEDGRLQRQQRDDVLDGPRPHGDHLYRQYLARNHLPPWFLSGGHMGMLSDTEEARRLGVEVPAALQEAGSTVPTEQQRVQTRSMLGRIHRAGRGIVNPTQIPAGLGRWEWLDSSDRETAEANGFGHSFEDITDARAAGALSLNSERQDVPSVVWYPDPQYLNPSSEPTEPGHWAFLTSGSDGHSAEGWAALNLGLTAGMSANPTASQIFRLRQQYRAQYREDLTADIGLVWIPGEEASESEGDDPVLQPLVPADRDSLFVRESESEQQEEEPEQQPAHGILGPGIQPSDFDPTNGNPGGITDQTARFCPPRYYTYRIGGRIITMDRARAEVGKVEPHKTCVFTEEGWQQHTKHIELNWFSKETPVSLARWREQAARRAGWPDLRPERRVVYADDENAWVAEQVNRELDAGRPYKIAETYLEFQKLFGHRRFRTEVGVGSLMLRKKYEWFERNKPSKEVRALLDGEGAEVVEGEGEELNAEEPVEGEEQDQANEQGEEQPSEQGEEQPSEQGEEQDPEEDALMAEIEALERENEAEDVVD